MRNSFAAQIKSIHCVYFQLWWTEWANKIMRMVFEAAMRNDIAAAGDDDSDGGANGAAFYQSFNRSHSSNNNI